MPTSRRRISKEQLIALIEKHETLGEIATELGVHVSTVQKSIKAYGISRLSARYKIHPSQLPEIIDGLKQGFSLESLACRFGVEQSSIYRAARKASFVARKELSREAKRRKYSVNQDYFSVINTLEKAYFLGLLAADGFVSTNKRMLVLQLHSKDIELLERFKDALEFSGNIVPVKGKNQYRLTVCSTKMCKSLSVLNIVPNKTHQLSIPQLGDRSLYLAYLRGLIDGDGHINSQKVTIVNASDTLVQDIQGLSPKKLYTRTANNCHYIIMCKRDKEFVQEIFKFVGLSRKQQVFNDFWTSAENKGVELKDKKLLG